MIIFIFIIMVTAIIGICCAFSNNIDLDSSNIILALLGFMVLALFAIFGLLNESNTSIINTYCTKYYGNNVARYNECKYNHKDNFSKVIRKGIK